MSWNSRKRVFGPWDSDRLVVIYPGERRYALTEQVEVVPLMEVCAKGGNLFEGY